MPALNQPPAWVADAVFYQIFPDRFARSGRAPTPSNLQAWDGPPTPHGYKGGDLWGVIERLDWLVELGVNAIYFNPIFHSASNHRYHTYDYLRVDPLLGDNVAFDELIEECHGRGLRVVIDGVFNHASRGFFQFHDILENGAESPWLDWFNVQSFPVRAYESSGVPNYQAWWGMPALPEFNTDNPAVREYLMGVGEHWVRKGIDGWRLDVPLEISTPGFWEEFRTRVRAVNPDTYIVGEIWDEATDWIGRGDRFDGTMNYQLTSAIIAFAAGRRVVDQVVEGTSYQVRPPRDAGAFADSLDHLLQIYPATAQRANLNLLDSHDTPRLLTVAGGDRDSVVLSALLLFGMPGAPCIYYGDEIGLPGSKDPDCRRAFPWDHPGTWDRTLLESYRSLISLRKAHPALRGAGYRRLWPLSGLSGMLYASLREAEGEQLVLAANAGDDAASATLPAVGNPTRLWGGGELTVGDGLRLVLPPRTGGVWSL